MATTFKTNEQVLRDLQRISGKFDDARKSTVNLAQCAGTRRKSELAAKTTHGARLNTEYK